jgi:hypothetical protein
MKQVNALKHEFVKSLPDKLEDGILYVSIDFVERHSHGIRVRRDHAQGNVRITEASLRAARERPRMLQSP